MEFWVGLVILGLFHGLNPAMGWLLAVVRGFLEGRLEAVVRAIVPIGLGHLVGVSLSLVPLLYLGLHLPHREALGLAGVGLVLLALYLWCRKVHPRVRLRAGAGELFLWSALLALGHGAGAMLLPLCLSGPPLPFGGMEAVFIHTLATLLAMTGLALLAFRLGAEVVPRLWPNYDRIWAIGLLATGISALVQAWPP